MKFSNKNIVQAKDNAKFHYNLGSEDLFFRCLDANSPYNIAPTYTCVYWKEGTRDLNEAQFNKLEHVCRKVRLKPGDKLVDVGSGWGSLLFHAYEHYGISEGVNISPTPDQNRWMREKIALNNLESIIKVREAELLVYTQAWAKNFDDNWPVIQSSNPEKFDEKFRRRWHMYLWACAEGFDAMVAAGVGLYQIIFGKQATKAYPMSREFLYKNQITPVSTKLKR